MKILVTGSSGFVGKSLVRGLSKNYEVCGLSRRESDTTHFRADITSPDIKNLLNNINPDLLIHSVKLPKSVDYYEFNREEARNTEIGGTTNLVDWSRERKIKLILISTDYVYEGKTNNYREDSETKPVNYYGELKLQIERIVSNNLENYIILRPTVIFGYVPDDSNFLMQILNTKEKKRIPYDQISNPTDINVFADYTQSLIEKNATGLFVAAGPESINRYDFTLMIADIFSLDKALFMPVSTQELSQIAKRPLNNGTDSSRIRNYLNYSCPSLYESLQRIKRSI